MDNRIKPFGYEYQGFKLGQKIRLKGEEKEYTIIGFGKLENSFIGINFNFFNFNISMSEFTTSYIDNDYNCFRWVKPSNIEIIGEDMEKEEVLRLEYQEVFDKVAIRVAYQDDSIIQREKFIDEDLGIRSLACFEWRRNGELFVLGSRYDMDNHVIVVSKRDAEIIKIKVERLNKKYGKPKRWKGKLGDSYYYIFIENNEFFVEKTQEQGVYFDKNSWERGNYFKTHEEAQEVANKIRKIFEEVRNGNNREK